MRTTEGRILEVGCALALLWVLTLAGGWFWKPDLAQVLSGMTTANIFFGRAGGMSLGYAAGLEHTVVVPANLLIESIQVLVLYPLFVLSWQHLIEIRALRNAMRRMRLTAERYEERLRRYGLAGLFVFVCTPFVMTGPVVGAVLGFLIGLRPAVNLAVVLTATSLAIVGWAFVLHGVHDWASTYNRYAPFGLFVAITLLTFLVGLLGRRRPRR
ncbi:MAG: small multi-drug export protein [Verrucomicrobiales bacterium]|nr:small multi-drug export protein [Verrucomicrobiales bacterium]